ncbi:MAG: CDP-alcohol phosphatidyltransferase family protein [Planctomycetia bacterium]
MGIANLITVARGLMAAGVWAVAAGAESGGAPWWWVAFGLFVLTALTDVVDGHIARTRGEVSVFGRIADPLVDKLLVLGTMAVLVSLPGVREVLPAWVVLLVLARELIVTGLRAAVEGNGHSFGATAAGKLKMLAQCVALGAVLLHQAGVEAMRAPQAWLGGAPLAFAFVLLGALVTAVSLLEYLVRAARQLAQR